jgi:hypothetical protein
MQTNDYVVIAQQPSGDQLLIGSTSVQADAEKQATTACTDIYKQVFIGQILSTVERKIAMDVPLPIVPPAPPAV